MKAWEFLILYIIAVFGVYNKNAPIGTVNYLLWRLIISLSDFLPGDGTYMAVDWSPNNIRTSGEFWINTEKAGIATYLYFYTFLVVYGAPYSFSLRNEETPPEEDQRTLLQFILAGETSLNIVRVKTAREGKNGKSSDYFHIFVSVLHVLIMANTYV